MDLERAGSTCELRPGNAGRAAHIGGFAPKRKGCGVTVRHSTYGVGTISQISEIGQSTRAVIIFARVGQKTFILEAARLEVLG